MIDYHLHTSFSKDGKEDIFDICLAAKNAGLKYIAITDHLDYDDLLPENWEIKDITGHDGYLSKVAQMKKTFPELNITLGVEAGHTASGNDLVKEKIKLIEPDFVIGSLHFIDGYDVYDGIFFEGKTKKEAYSYYFEKLYESIVPLSEYSNVIGHLTYISKGPNVPYEDPVIYYSEYSKQIDEILKKIIECGLGIEINTSGLTRKVARMLPDLEIVTRYKELGGEILTVGSDAHLKEYVGGGIDKAYEAARTAGFKHLTIFPDGKRTIINL